MKQKTNTETLPIYDFNTPEVIDIWLRLKSDDMDVIIF